MSRSPLSEGERWQALRRQIGFIYRSVNQVTEGVEDEAVRVAVAVRVLVHDTSRSVSLLTQLGLRDRLQYLDTRPEPTVVAILADGSDGPEDERGLAVAHGDPLRWIAPLEQAPMSNPRLDFETWWNRDFIPVLRSEAGRISRHALMDFMAHQDGGAHVDPRGLDDRYRDLVVSGGGAVMTAVLDPQVRLPEDMPSSIDLVPLAGNAASATMAQIGYELVETMKDSGLCDQAFD